MDINKESINYHYFAGIFDSAGSIRIERAGKHPNYSYTSRMMLNTYNKELLDLIVAEFGGSLYKPTINGCYVWQSSGKNMDIILKKLLPFLIVRKSHIEVVMKFRKTVQPLGLKIPLSNKVMKIREDLYNEYRKLIFAPVTLDFTLGLPSQSERI